MFQEYPQNDVNVPILLHEGRFRLRWGDRVTEGPGSARLLWLPSPGIEVDVGTTHAVIDLDSVTVELPGFEIEDVVVYSTTLEPQGRIRAFVSGMESGCEQDLVSVGFQLVNFADIITPGLSAAPGDPTTLTHARGQTKRLLDRGGAVTCATARLGHDGWQVDLVAVPESADVKKGLKSSGGYGFTHVGLLKTADGSAFTADQASTILESLTAFLMFARGVRDGLTEDGLGRLGRRRRRARRQVENERRRSKGSHWGSTSKAAINTRRGLSDSAPGAFFGGAAHMASDSTVLRGGVWGRSTRPTPPPSFGAYQPTVARPTTPLSVLPCRGLSRRCASTPSSKFRLSRLSTPRA